MAERSAREDGDRVSRWVSSSRPDRGETSRASEATEAGSGVSRSDMLVLREEDRPEQARATERV